MRSLGCKFEKSVYSIHGLNSLQILSVVVAVEGSTPLAYQYVLGGVFAVHLVEFFYRHVASVDACVVLDKVFEDGLA